MKDSIAPILTTLAGVRSEIADRKSTEEVTCNSGRLPFVVSEGPGSAGGDGASLLDTVAQVANSEVQTDNEKRLEARKAYSRRIAEKFQPFDPSRAERVAGCCQNIVEIRYASGIERIYPEHRCNHKLCPVCANLRSRKLAGRYTEVLEKYKADKFGYHLVLTLQNSRELPKREEIARAVRNFVRRKYWKQHGGIEGGLYSLETTYNQDTGLWHPHLHLLIFTKYEIPTYWHKVQKRTRWQNSINQAVAEVWEKVTKRVFGIGSFIVDGSPFTGRVAEMLKYVTKFEKEGHKASLDEMPQEKFQELVEWIAGSRFVSAFGSLYGQIGEIEEAVDAEMEEEEKPPEYGEQAYTLTRKTWNGWRYETTSTEYYDPDIARDRHLGTG